MDRYVIRTAFWRIFGGAFYFEDLDGRVVAYSEQKRFKLKEDIVLFTDESCTVPLVQIKARSILDLGTTTTLSTHKRGSTLAQQRGTL